ERERVQQHPDRAAVGGDRVLKLVERGGPHVVAGGVPVVEHHRHVMRLELGDQRLDLRHGAATVHVGAEDRVPRGGERARGGGPEARRGSEDHHPRAHHSPPAVAWSWPAWSWPAWSSCGAAPASGAPSPSFHSMVTADWSSVT